MRPSLPVLSFLLALPLGATSQTSKPAQRQSSPASNTTEAKDNESVQSRIAWIKLKAEEGNATYQYWLGIGYLTGEVAGERGPTEGLHWLKKASSNGYAKADLALAAAFLSDKLGPPDLKEVIHWGSRAAEAGFKGAFIMTAMALSTIDAPEFRDYKKAYIWFRVANHFGESEYSPKMIEILQKGLPPEDREAADKVAQRSITRLTQVIPATEAAYPAS